MEADPEDVEALKREKPGYTPEDIERLSRGEPLAYVIGTIPFLGLTLRLDSRPLIPRPETEWWTEEHINELTQGGMIHHTALRVLDLCAGSGAIGLALAKHIPGALVSFGELSEEHTALIRKNAEDNGIDASRIDARAGDLFAPFAGELFNLIVTNPPYIPEKRVLPESVSLYEPREALYAGADGLALIRRIARAAPEYLAPGGRIYCECDIEHIEEARRLFAAGLRSATIRTDQYGRPRVVVALT